MVSEQGAHVNECEIAMVDPLSSACMGSVRDTEYAAVGI